MKRRTIFGGVALALLIFAGGAIAIAGEPPKVSPPGTLGVLERASTGADALPTWYQELPAAEHMLIDEAKLVGEVEGRSYYIVPGESQTTCLVYVTEMGESAGTCAATSGLMSNGLYFTEIGGAGEDAAVTAVALPDGFDSATMDTGGRVVGEGQNLVVIQGPPPLELTITGDKMLDVEWEIGYQSPPEQ